MNSDRSTESDKIRARKAFLKERLPGVELSPTFIYKAAIEDGGIWVKRQWLYWLLLHSEVCKALDIKTWKQHLDRVNSYLLDIHTSSLQVNVLRRLEIHKL